MIESIDTSLIDWSRAQFAMTAMYHWIFVPLTLGLAVVMGIMETLYYKTGNEFWKKTAQFWMKLFGINFAIGVATGLILEFEFGTNSNSRIKPVATPMAKFIPKSFIQNWAVFFQNSLPVL